MEPDPEDVGPDLPALASFILEHFWQLHRTRQWGFGMEAVTWQELRAYQKENRIKLDCWEKDLVLDVDQCLRKHYGISHQTKQQGAVETKPHLGKVPGVAHAPLPLAVHQYMAANRAKAEAAAKAKAEEALAKVDGEPISSITSD